MTRQTLRKLGCLSAFFILCTGAASARAEDGPFEPRPGPPARIDQFGDPLPPAAISRMGTVRFRAGSPLNAIRYAPDGSSIIACGLGELYVWDTLSGRPLRRFGDFSMRRKDASLDVNYPFAISPDQKHVAATGPDTRIRIYSLDSGKKVLEWEVPLPKEVGNLRVAFSNIVYSPDGRLLLTADRTGTARLWDAASGAEVRTLSAPESCVRAMAFSPDGRVVGYAHLDRSIRLVATGTGEALARCRGHRQIAAVLQVSPDGQKIASANSRYSANDEGGDNVSLWDVASGRELCQLRGADPATPLAFSPDGVSLATTVAGFIQIWDLATGKERLKIKGHSQGSLKAIHALAFSLDGKRLASCGLDQTIRQWNPATGTELTPSNGHQARVIAATFSPDNHVLASASDDQTIRLWEVATGRELARFEVDDVFGGGSVHGTQLYFSPDGRRVYAGGQKSRIHFLDIDNGRQAPFQEQKGQLAASIGLSLDGKCLIAAEIPAQTQRRDSSSVISIWDTATRRELHKLQDVPGTIVQTGISPDLQTVFGCSLDVKDNGVHYITWDATAWKVIAQRKIYSSAPPNRSSAVSLSSDGHMAALAVYDSSMRTYLGSRIPVVDTVTGAEVCLLETPQRIFKALAIAPDSRTVAAIEQNGEIHRWELASGKERRAFSGDRGLGRALAFSSDSSMLATGGDDSSVIIWDLQGRLEPHKTALGARDLELAWSGLKDGDALQAERAMNVFVAGGKQSVAFIGRHLETVKAADENVVGQLVEQLGSKDYEVRMAAQNQLASLGESAVSGLRKALQMSWSLQTRRRIERLIDVQTDARANPGSDRLRTVRALEVLEEIHLPEARELFVALSTGIEDSWQTKDAKQVLRRWSNREHGSQ